MMAARDYAGFPTISREVFDYFMAQVHVEAHHWISQHHRIKDLLTEFEAVVGDRAAPSQKNSIMKGFEGLIRDTLCLSQTQEGMKRIDETLPHMTQPIREHTYDALCRKSGTHGVPDGCLDRPTTTDELAASRAAYIARQMKRRAA